MSIHQIEASSRANGPGIRTVIWLQGCTLACPGCFNPETHPAGKGEEMDWKDLSQNLIHQSKAIEGITISGGEPLQQASSLKPFLSVIRNQSNLSIILFTGYSWKEILNNAEYYTIVKLTDVVLAGRYNQKKRTARSLIGSSNKTMHFMTRRYDSLDFEAIPEAEVLISEDGTITYTGIDPLRHAPS
ncbi:MAG: radical SAM protein [Anaerolineaceae bacterium]|nr:radical SAM protein [Anaerolineaceae bacterium]